MEKHSITIDTEKNIFLLDGKPIKNAEKIEIKVTPLETEVTLTIKQCTINFQGNIHKEKSFAQSVEMKDAISKAILARAKEIIANH